MGPGATQLGGEQYLARCACPGSVCTPSTGNLRDGLLQVEAAVDGPVKEVKVPVRSPTGEITYQTFIAAPPSTSRLDQESAVARSAVKVDGASGLCPSPHPVGIPVSTAPNTSNHRHDVHNHEQESLGFEKAVDGKSDTERREDVDVVSKSFSEADRAAVDDCASL